jgi:hypothetical protein
MTRPIIARAAALLLASAPLGAQAAAPATLPAYARLRVHPRASARAYQARLVRMDADTVWVRPWSAAADAPDAAFAVPLASLRRLERFEGRSTHILRNTGIGAAAGALVGGAIGAIAAVQDDDSSIDFEPGPAALFVGAALTLPGAIVGALTGTVPTDDWRAVALPSEARREAAGPRVRPSLALVRVPVRGAPAARALSLGITVVPR